MRPSPTGCGIGRRGALLGLLALAGCGFTPVYGPGGAGLALNEQVEFDLPATPFGYRLGTRLENRLGRAESARWRLTVRPQVTEETTAISTDGDVTRLTLVGNANWSLTDLATGAERDSGQVDSFSGYSATGSTVATTSAREDAEERLAVILVDLIVTRLSALSL